MLSRIFQRRRRTRVGPALRPEDIGFLSPVRGAHVVEPAPAAMWAVYLLLALLAAAVAWATVAQVDIVVRANARVVPDGREQVIASLEGGILRELKVREGQQVAAGDELALIDPTRFEAQQAEGAAFEATLGGSWQGPRAGTNGSLGGERLEQAPDGRVSDGQDLDGRAFVSVSR